VLPTLSKLLNLVKESGKIGGVWGKGVPCSVLGELKHIKILSLKSLMVSLSLEYKEIL
jgi:hypothetical protein